MATLTTTNLKSAREDLANFISQISPEETPVRTEIGKSKASGTYHENLLDTLSAANKDNARVEGDDALVASNTGPTRVGNWNQIFAKEVTVSGTVIAVDTAGTNNEKARQIAKAGSELNRDIEASIVSQNASVASGVRKSAGMEAIITTNKQHGTGGLTPGFVNGLVGAVTNGTTRALTEAMFNTMAQTVWAAGGDPKMVIAPGTLKVAISKFNGNATKYQDAKNQTIYAGVDVYVSDFGTHNIIPHRWMTATTVISFDPKLWSVATLRPTFKKELGASGDNEKLQIITELTLESKNEAGNGKISDVTA